MKPSGWSIALWRVTLFLVGLVAYVLSSGPVLAIAFWLRDATGRNGFYNVIYLYFPLFFFRRTAAGQIAEAYVEWWLRIFGTVGPR